MADSSSQTALRGDKRLATPRTAPALLSSAVGLD